MAGPEMRGFLPYYGDPNMRSMDPRMIGYPEFGDYEVFGGGCPPPPPPPQQYYSRGGYGYEEFVFNPNCERPGCGMNDSLRTLAPLASQAMYYHEANKQQARDRHSSKNAMIFGILAGLLSQGASSLSQVQPNTQIIQQTINPQMQQESLPGQVPNPEGNPAKDFDNWQKKVALSDSEGAAPLFDTFGKMPKEFLDKYDAAGKAYTENKTPENGNALLGLYKEGMENFSDKVYSTYTTNSNGEIGIGDFVNKEQKELTDAFPLPRSAEENELINENRAHAEELFKLISSNGQAISKKDLAAYYAFLDSSDGKRSGCINPSVLGDVESVIAEGNPEKTAELKAKINKNYNDLYPGENRTTNIASNEETAKTEFSNWTKKIADSIVEEPKENEEPIKEFNLAGEDFTKALEDKETDKAGTIYKQKALDMAKSEIALYDTNHDGVIDPKEQIDTDKKDLEQYGRLGSSEANQAQETSLRAFTFMDLNQDKKVDDKEYAAFLYAMDGNNDKKTADGKITQEEYKTSTSYLDNSSTEAAGKFRGSVRASYKTLFGVDPKSTEGNS